MRDEGWKHPTFPDGSPEPAYPVREHAAYLLAGSYAEPGASLHSLFILSPPQNASPAEFRSYRRFVTAFVLIFVSLGSGYLLMSVGITIYRQRHAAPTDERVGDAITSSEIQGCFAELDDVTQGLAKHLENFHHLLARYDAGEAQRWAEEGTVWRRQWEGLGKRCRFPEIRGPAFRKEIEEMATAYAELGETHQIYTKSLRQFGRDQAPRLDRVRERLGRIGERLSRMGAPTGEMRK